MADSGIPGRYGEIYDRGYQHYLGQRLGRQHAIWALILYSIKRAMGIKKSWTAKVIPFILYLASVGVVLVIIGIEAFVRSSDQLVMSYPDYIGFIYAIVGAFVATIAPEMLCGDRRENVLALYFSRAISRLDYVLSKVAAVGILTMTISVVPAFFMWLFRQLMADRPLSALRDNAGDLGRVMLVGTLIAFYLGCGGLVISSFTGRKSIATAIIFVGYTVLEGFVNGLRQALDPGQLRDVVTYLSPIQHFAGMAEKLYGEQTPDMNSYPATTDVLVAIAVILVGITIMVWRYVPED